MHEDLWGSWEDWTDEDDKNAQEELEKEWIELNEIEKELSILEDEMWSKLEMEYNNDDPK